MGVGVAMVAHSLPIKASICAIYWSRRSKGLSVFNVALIVILNTCGNNKTKALAKQDPSPVQDLSSLHECVSFQKNMSIEVK